MKSQRLSSRRSLALFAVLLSATVGLSGFSLAAPPNPPKKTPPGKAKPGATDSTSATTNSVPLPAVPRTSKLTSDAWLGAPLTAVSSAEIDQIVAKELAQDKITPAPLTTDEQFIRRVTLDLTGHLPLPADVSEFVANRDTYKRANLIDKLLDSEEYARHWASYWRDVIAAKVIDRRGMLSAHSFEEWMTAELKKNTSWDKLVKAMLTVSGEVRYDKPEANGAAFFLTAHTGPEAANDRAAETSRIFLGIQIQCAQCHDHPFDQWKRVQFHELAGYFARMRERPIRDGNRIVGYELMALPRGEHEMASKEDPKKTVVTPPLFLDGKSSGKDLPDKERRSTLATAVVDKNNYWFAGAFVNRIWGDLMGQSFYQPVDDMGPLKDAVFANVLVRVASSFRATNYDVKELFRVVLNSRTYQRQIRLGESSDQHLHFASAYPTQLRADALWESLTTTLGQMGPAGPPKASAPGAGMLGQRPGLEGEFKRLFDYDPSLKADEVEGSIPQALMLMNNPQINNKIRAAGANLLGRILNSYPSNNDAIEMLYMRTLARKPTSREVEKCTKYIQKTSNRNEAFEDLLWALVNSTEFQTKR